MTRLAMLTAACVPSFWLCFAPTLPRSLVAIALLLASGAAWVVRSTIRRDRRDNTALFRTIGSWMSLTIPSAVLVARSIGDEGSQWGVAGGVTGILLGSHVGFPLALLSAQVGDALAAPSFRTSARAALLCGRWLAIMHTLTAVAVSLVARDGLSIALALALAAPPIVLLVAGWLALRRQARFLDRVRNGELSGWTLVPARSVPSDLRVRLLPWAEDHGSLVLARVRSSAQGYRDSPEIEPVALV